MSKDNTEDFTRVKQIMREARELETRNPAFTDMLIQTWHDTTMTTEEKDNKITQYLAQDPDFATEFREKIMMMAQQLNPDLRREIDEIKRKEPNKELGMKKIDMALRKYVFDNSSHTTYLKDK